MRVKGGRVGGKRGRERLEWDRVRGSRDGVREIISDNNGIADMSGFILCAFHSWCACHTLIHPFIHPYISLFILGMCTVVASRGVYNFIVAILCSFLSNNIALTTHIFCTPYDIRCSQTILRSNLKWPVCF